MYVRVLAIDGVPQVGTARLISGQSLSPTEAIAIIEGELQTGWTELTEAEFLALGGEIPQPIEPQLSQPDRLSQLEAVIDTLLTGGVTP